MTAPLDLDALRRTIAAAPDEGIAASVTKAWLDQVEREIRKGRAAIAELSMQRRMSAAIDQIGQERLAA